jgi:4-aminobutyrate aminotransferase-like enzyme
VSNPETSIRGLVVTFARAGHRQLERMPATTQVLANPVTAACMDEPATCLGEPLEHVWLGSDGADAVELAMKLARRLDALDSAIARASEYVRQRLPAAT